MLRKSEKTLYPVSPLSKLPFPYEFVPVSHTEHSLLDATPPGATIFLHEDILARTLAYEQELQEWRRSELRAGRTDPGRPAYEDVFSVGNLLGFGG